MKKLCYLLVLAVMVISGCKESTKAPSKVEIKNDGWYYINGEKFFIKSLGYEQARPGQDPYHDSIKSLHLMQYDLKVIKDAGFNCIRTWSQLSEEQLQLVQESGLKIIFGIWIKPEKDYGDSTFLRQSEDLVKKVVSYTKKYDCVISYLILNEPMPEHMYKCGAKATANMLKDLKGILNTEHPGIPVTISGNCAIDEFMDQNLFDVNAYNAYGYNEGQNGTLGYAGFLEWCQQMNGNTRPLIITEFGYSVSETGAGKNTYGGNTLEEQKNGVIANYRALIDAGATGACPFYYADGWWKGGHDSIHNNAVEEWFGYFGYSDLKDSIGSPRPVWYALESYLKALVVTPKNEHIYGDKIPLELYLDPSVSKVVVKLNDSVLYSKQVAKEGYMSDTISYSPKGMEGAELAFEFFDKDGKILKTESIYTLLSKEPVNLPKLTIDVTPSDYLGKAKVCKMKINLSNLGKFKVEGDIRYNFNYHIGWEHGVQDDIQIKDNKDNKDVSFEQSSSIPENSRVLAASAGVTVKYGKCRIRLHDQRLIYQSDWFIGLGRTETQYKK